MGKRFQISILENIKDHDRELIYDAKNLPLEQVYSKCEEDDFFIKLKVKSVYHRWQTGGKLWKYGSFCRKRFEAGCGI